MSEKFTKTDMERVALFQEMGYVTIGDQYSDKPFKFKESKKGSREMLIGGSKSKAATQAGYFGETFPRILEGEAYSDQVKMRRQYRMKEAQKNIAKPFIPSNGEKLQSGLGNYYGTFSGPIPAVSAQVKTGKGYKAPGKNFYTNPGKKGTGYGYTGLTLGGYGEHSSDKYDQYREIMKRDNEAHKKAVKGGAFRLNMAPKQFFDENPFRSDHSLPPQKKTADKKWDTKPFKPSSPGKQDGGMKAGTFDVYPTHSNDPYKSKTGDISSSSSSHQSPSASNKKVAKTFMPPAGPKSAPANSVLDQNIVRTMNVQNYRTVQSVMSY